MTRTAGIRFAVLGAAAAATLLAGCGGHANPDPHPHSPAILLSAHNVGGTVVPKAQRHLQSAGCGLDGLDLFGGSSADNTVLYRRSVAGHHETVIIGAWHWGGSGAAAAFADLRRALALNPTCDPPTHAARLSGQPKGTLDFTASSVDKDGVRHRVLRSYRYLKTGQVMVMVSLERTDGSQPSATDLAHLVSEQVVKVRSKIATSPEWSPPE